MLKKILEIFSKSVYTYYCVLFDIYIIVVVEEQDTSYCSVFMIYIGTRILQREKENKHFY